MEMDRHREETRRDMPGMGDRGWRAQSESGNLEEKKGPNQRGAVRTANRPQVTQALKAVQR